MNARRHFCIAALLALAAPLAAQAAEPIRVATDATFPPMEFVENGKRTGFDVELVEALTPEIMAMAGEANAAAAVGTGGMRTKLEAARIARSAGCATVIASGLEPHPLAAVVAGARATLFPAPGGPVAAWKAWIAGSVQPAGRLVVDDGAVAALRGGKSLLPSGVRAVEGRFDKGDSVLIVTVAGVRAGVGLASWAAEEMVLILGRKTAEIEGLVGYKGPQVAIHRDDLVLEGEA